MLTLLLGIVYPLVITGVSQVAFPGNANGQQVFVNGRLVGSKIIGQSFASPVIDKNGKPELKQRQYRHRADPRYFQTRPSATDGRRTTPPRRTFANYGPEQHGHRAGDRRATSQAYLDARTARTDPGGLTAAKIPVDAADTSASGSTRTSRRPTPASRPTASPPCATSRWRRSTA